MKTVLANLAPGFEKIETITAINIIRRAGARVALTNTFAGVLQIFRGIKVASDDKLNAVMEIDKQFDLICLPEDNPE
jgi:hypothetical protein